MSIRIDSRKPLDLNRSRFDHVRSARTILTPLAEDDNGIKHAEFGTTSPLHILDLTRHGQSRDALEILTDDRALPPCISPHSVSFGEKGVRNIGPSPLRARVGGFIAPVLSEAPVRILTGRDDDPGLFDQAADPAAGEADNVFGVSVQCAGVTTRDEMGTAKRAVEENVDFDVVHVESLGRHIRDPKRRSGEKDGKAESMGD